MWAWMGVLAWLMAADFALAAEAQPNGAPSAEEQEALPDAFSHMAKAPDVDLESLRDPFESYLAMLEKMRQRRAARFQRNRPTEPLERFDLSTLKLVAIFRRGNVRVAMVEDPSGKGYIVRRGSHIGRNGGRVEKITDDTVYIVEQILNPAGEIVERQVTMTLKEVNQP